MAKSTAPALAYAAAVEEGKQIVQRQEAGQWRLGELADAVETEYGQKKLEQFARAIGIDAATLERHRDVYRAWAEIPAPGRESLSYSVLRDLAAYPDRAQIVWDNPKLTKRQAAKIVRKYADEQRLKQEAAKPRPTDEEVWSTWQNDLIEHIRKSMENQERWQKPNIPPLPNGARVNPKLLRDLKRAERFFAEVHAAVERNNRGQAPVASVKEAA